MGRIGRPGNETSAQPLAIYLAQTSSEPLYKEAFFAKSVRTYPHLADADVNYGSLLLLVAAFQTPVSSKQSHAAGQYGLSFNLQDIREFFLIPQAQQMKLKAVDLHRKLMPILW